MNNITRLLNRENKWYKIGPLIIGRGISKRIPLYYLFLLAFIGLSSLLPLTPFWFIAQIKGGWMLNFIVLPLLVATGLQEIKQAGKTPEKYLWSLFRFAISQKIGNPYRPLNKPAIYQYGTTYTYRFKPREEGVNDQKIH